MKRFLAGYSMQITGSRESSEEPKLKFTVHLMQLTAQDLQSLQFDSSTIPSPKFRSWCSFKLPLGYSVVYVLFSIRRTDITDAFHLSLTGERNFLQGRRSCLRRLTGLET
jgi:hypothetical protein